MGAVSAGFFLNKKYARLRTFMFVWNIFKFVWQN